MVKVATSTHVALVKETAVATGEGVEAGVETGVLAEVGLGYGGGGENLFEGGNWQDRTGGYA